MNFNPRSYVRSDKTYGVSRLRHKIFQSTLLCKERLGAKGYKQMAMNFNPRSYVRSDIKFYQGCFIFRISIHAPM